MTTLLRGVLRALERVLATHPWDHNAHYHRWFLRQPPGVSTAPWMSDRAAVT